MRTSALALVTACAAPPPPASVTATATQSPPTLRTATVPSSSRQAATSPLPLDTSVTTVWGYDPERTPSGINYYAPPPRPTPASERDWVAHEVARPRKPGRSAPCFPKRDVLVVSELYNDLRAYQVYMGEDEPRPAPSRYGTCRVTSDGELRDARGTRLANISCGVMLWAPGIIDDLGFEVGSAGKDLTAVYTGAPICMTSGDAHVTCWFTPEGEPEPLTKYGFHGTLTPGGGDDDGMLRGDAARAFIERGTVSTILDRGSCH